LHLQPSEIENLPFYELQYTIDNLVEHLKKEKDAHDDEKGSYSTDKMTSDMNRNMSSMGKSPGTSSPSMPKMPSISGAAMKSPSLKMPKF